MARITMSHAVADRNRRVASELARIRKVPGDARTAGRRRRSCPSKTALLPSGQARIQAPASTPGCSRRGQEIAEAADGLDDVDVELLADAADEDLNGVGVAVEILVVEMLDELGARHHAPRMMHQVG